MIFWRKTHQDTFSDHQAYHTALPQSELEHIDFHLIPHDYRQEVGQWI